MKIIKPYFEILSVFDGNEIIKNIERAGRTCYKSEERITQESAEQFVKMIIEKGHESVLEHEKLTILFVCDRGVSHEIVRHRIASFSQESTRYCNYSTNKFENQLTYILPLWITEIPEGNYNSICPTHKTDELEWFRAIQESEQHYLTLINKGWLPQQARSVLPNSLKTEIVVTANLREWRTIFNQRTSRFAHPQMVELMRPLLSKLKLSIPIVFDDFFKL